MGEKLSVYTVANVVSSNATAMASMDISHSVFSAQMVNKRAYDSNTWVIDTGAIDHIVCYVHLLTTIIAITQSIVQLPNGETALVTHIGTVTLSSSLILQNVLYVPSFTFNLLSVSTFTKSQPYCLVFLSTFCFIHDLTFWRTIGVGHAINGLYLLQCDSFQQASSTTLTNFLANIKLGDVFHPFSTATSHSSLSSLWHARLGHPSDSKLQALSHIFPFL